MPSPDKYSSTGQLLPALSRSTKKSLIYLHERKNFFDEQTKKRYTKKGPGDYDITLFDEKKCKNKRFFTSKSSKYTFSDEMLDAGQRPYNKHYNIGEFNVSYKLF